MLSWSVPLKRGPQTTHRFFGCAAGPVEDKVYSFGGFFYEEKTYRRKDQIDVHVFNTVTLCLTTLSLVARKKRRGECPLDVPSMRCRHTAGLIEDTIYIWGGIINCKMTVDDWVTGDYDNILYAFDIDTLRWFKPKVSGIVPEKRHFHSACVLGKAMFIHGGCNQSAYTNDLYKLDTTTMTWALMNMRGIPLFVSVGHSATIIGTKMFVFGGYANGNYRNDIRVFDTETDCWMRTQSAQPVPEPRRFHSAFTYNGELYIIGGSNNGLSGQRFNDVWKFNSKTFSWKKVEPKGKGPDWVGSMYCCMLGDRIILFGPRLILQILHLSPSLKTLCKLAVIECGLDQSGLPHNIRWELAGMT